MHEGTDSSNKEQVIVCLRWVDSQFEPHEDFVGFHCVDNIKTDIIVHVLKDTVLRTNLFIVEGSYVPCSARFVQFLSNQIEVYVVFHWKAFDGTARLCRLPGTKQSQSSVRLRSRPV